jgi:predicted phosphodiesterase
MPRRAIISDVHSNLPALEAVLADIEAQKVDGIVCLGDICGYGPEPVECINLVREKAMWTLKGNHDEALFHEPKDFGPNARAAIEWQRTILQPKDDSPADVKERWEWLKNLPPSRLEKNVLFVHASPRDPIYEYVLREDFHDSGLGPTQRAKDIFQEMDWLCFCGHSHRPGVVAEDYKWWRPAELENNTSLIKPGFKTIVNVGSVGQPRDNVSAACYVIFDYEEADANRRAPVSPKGSGTMIQIKKTDDPSLEDTRYGDELQQARNTAILRAPRVTFRRVEYNIPEAQSRFKKVPQLPENNGLRLSKGL